MRTTIAKAPGAVLLLAALIAPVAPAAGAATDVAIGYCTDDLEQAKAAGFAYAEPAVRNFTKLSDEEFERLLERHRAVGLSTPVGNLFLPSDLKVVGPEADHERALAWARTAFQRAKRLGLEIVVFGSGGARKAPDGFSGEEAFAQLVALGKRLGPEARRQGVVVAVEPLRRQETNTINSVAEGLRWVEAVGDAGFQLMVDFYHLASEGEDPAILQRAGRYLRHVHIANPSGRVFPLSAGEADYARFFAALRAAGYRGRVSVEGRTTDLAADAPRAIAFLRSAAAGPEETEARQARLAWFKQAKYGLFIHWGLYAIPAGEWKG
ncbi:MAG TPA: TIM barrel protein, partial [Vicinamibacteria bacterium]|nr:TIM barrel protein [Vicinamibacteria bacterium]